MISWLFVDKASKVRNVFTFDGNNELRQDGQDLVRVSLHQFFCSLNRQKLIWFLSLSKAFEENGEVKMVIEVFWLQLPRQLSYLT